MSASKGADRRQDTVPGCAAPGSSGTGHPAAMARRRVMLRGAVTLDHGHPDHPDMSTTRWNRPAAHTQTHIKLPENYTVNIYKCTVEREVGVSPSLTKE